MTEKSSLQRQEAQLRRKLDAVVAQVGGDEHWQRCGNDLAAIPRAREGGQAAEAAGGAADGVDCVAIKCTFSDRGNFVLNSKSRARPSHGRHCLVRTVTG